MSSAPADTRGNPQAQHYAEIHGAYKAHYYDDASMAYRRRFIYEPLFAHVDLDGKSVAELACGSGANSLELKRLFPTARLTGYDISQSACADYRALTGSPAHIFDLTKLADPPDVHDAAFVIGGIHHCVAGLDATFRNMARLLRPGGALMMMEPSNDCFLAGLRNLWYQRDGLFEAESERALKHDEIAGEAAPWFTPKWKRYFGGPAYYAILNSLVLRIPLRAKPALAAVLTPLERLYGLLPGRTPFAAFLAEWRRTDAPA